MKERIHFCPICQEESYTLCSGGNLDPKARVCTDLGKVNCEECIQVAYEISQRVSELYLLYEKDRCNKLQVKPIFQRNISENLPKKKDYPIYIVKLANGNYVKEINEPISGHASPCLIETNEMKQALTFTKKGAQYNAKYFQGVVEISFN